MKLIKKLEALKPDFGDMGPGPEIASYMDGVNDAITILRAHADDLDTLEVVARAIHSAAFGVNEPIYGDDITLARAAFAAFIGEPKP